MYTNIFINFFFKFFISSSGEALTQMITWALISIYLTYVYMIYVWANVYIQLRIYPRIHCPLTSVKRAQIYLLFDDSALQFSYDFFMFSFSFFYFVFLGFIALLFLLIKRLSVKFSMKYWFMSQAFWKFDKCEKYAECRFLGGFLFWFIQHQLQLEIFQSNQGILWSINMVLRNIYMFISL